MTDNNVRDRAREMVRRFDRTNNIVLTEYLCEKLAEFFEREIQLLAESRSRDDLGQSVPEGWVLVPREPTEAMLDALHDRIRILVDPNARTADIQNDREVWSAMLAATPAPDNPAMVEDDAAFLRRVSEGDHDGPGGKRSKFTPAPDSPAIPEDAVTAAIIAFNGGMINLPDDKNPRGYTTRYLPKIAVRKALEAGNLVAPAVKRGSELKDTTND